MKKDKYLPIQTPQRHKRFICSLECARCNSKPVIDFKFDGDWHLSLPICHSCIDAINGGYGFKSCENARKMAHNLCLYSGDFYSAAMIINKEKQESFT